jgi:diphosphomevalonate decarboxylase
MHAAMHSARPPLIYWQPGSVGCLHAVAELRRQGIGAWATMDAGPQVKVLCAPTDAARVAEALAAYATSVVVLSAGGPARLID